VRSLLASLLRVLVIPFGAGSNQPAVIIGVDPPAELVAFYAAFNETVVALTIERKDSNRYAYEALVQNNVGQVAVCQGSVTVSPLSVSELLRREADPGANNLIVGFRTNAFIQFGTSGGRSVALVQWNGTYTMIGAGTALQLTTGAQLTTDASSPTTLSGSLTVSGTVSITGSLTIGGAFVSIGASTPVTIDGVLTVTTPSTAVDGSGKRIFPKTATTTATTDASGNITVTHGFGATPTAVMAAPQAPQAGTVFSQYVIDSITSTTFRIRCISNVGNAIASTSVTFRWVAYGD